MVAKGRLSFAGVPLEDFGIYVSGYKTHGAPERDQTVVSIPGRNGDLVYDNGRYFNTDVTYHIGLKNPAPARAMELRNYLLSKNGYQRLEDSFHPDEFRMARYKGGFDPEIKVRGRVGELDIVFDCKPQRFLALGEQAIEKTSSPVTIWNPTHMTAKPLIRVYGNGTVAIGNVTMTITNPSNPYVDVDCELMDAYCGAANLNSCISTPTPGQFFELVPGNNNIVFTCTKIIVIPRWWRL